MLTGTCPLGSIANSKQTAFGHVDRCSSERAAVRGRAVLCYDVCFARVHIELTLPVGSYLPLNSSRIFERVYQYNRTDASNLAVNEPAVNTHELHAGDCSILLLHSQRIGVH